MSEKIKINRLTNANVYLDGGSLLGRVSEFNAPKVNAKMAEHSALGMIGSVEYFAGIDKLEGSIKWTAYYGSEMRKFANFFKPIRIQVRGSLEQYQGGGKVAEIPATIFLTIQPKNFPLGDYKQHDNVDLQTDYACTYCRLEIDGNVEMEIDVEANIYKVNGEDLLAAYRQNLGI